MTVPEAQREVAGFLAALAGREPTETHISAVFVGRDTVWKLKKAVKLSFLDFTTVAERGRLTRRELALNQPAAPGLYRDVVPVVRRADGSLGLGGEGTTLDWVLRMARVPAEDFFDGMAAAGRLTPVLLDQTADVVAAYHAAAPTAAHADPAARLRRGIAGNFAAAGKAGLDPATVDRWHAGVTAAVDAQDGRLAARAARVRRAHGDLHLGNLCLWQGRPVPFDALEFDEAMATIDLGYDLAFLLMDLDQRVGRPAANRVLNRYVDRTGDADMLAPMPLFLSMRAMIRAHVAASSGDGGAAEGYLRAALAYLDPPPPVLVAIGGLPGTGKSTLARALAPGIGAAPGAVILRSDTIRKRRHDVAPEQRLGPDAYTREANAGVAAELAALARRAFAGGHAVIADATFTDPTDRARIASLGTPFAGFWLTAPPAELERRIAARTGDASDATPEVLRRMSTSVCPPENWCIVDGSDAESAVRQMRDHLRQR